MPLAMAENGHMEHQKRPMNKTTKGMRDRESYETVVSESEKPFLFVVGKNDQAVPIDLSLKQIAVPKYSNAILLDSVGHMGMFEKPDETVNFIEGFLNFCR